MEACGSAHFWARKLHVLGHTVRLMAPQFVKPYVKTNKNDMADADADAIYERFPDRTCASCLLMMSSNKRCWRFIGFGRAW